MPRFKVKSACRSIRPREFTTWGDADYVREDAMRRQQEKYFVDQDRQQGVQIREVESNKTFDQMTSSSSNGSAEFEHD